MLAQKEELVWISTLNYILDFVQSVIVSGDLYKR